MARLTSRSRRHGRVVEASGVGQPASGEGVRWPGPLAWDGRREPRPGLGKVLPGASGGKFAVRGKAFLRASGLPRRVAHERVMIPKPEQAAQIRMLVGPARIVVHHNILCARRPQGQRGIEGIDQSSETTGVPSSKLQRCDRVAQGVLSFFRP